MNMSKKMKPKPVSPQTAIMTWVAPEIEFTFEKAMVPSDFDALFGKSGETEDDDGVLTPLGMDVAAQYARFWVDKAARDLTLERKYPELSGLFYDIRSDPQLAGRHAAPDDPVTPPSTIFMPQKFVIPMA